MLNNELEKLLAQIETQNQTRQALSQIRAMIKEESLKQFFYNIIEPKINILIDLLQDSDAKTRKNAALLIGDIADVVSDQTCASENLLEEKLLSRSLTDALYQGYVQESQLFVKSSYLNAIRNYDYRPYLEEFQHRKEKLSAMKPEESERKHINEEIHILNHLIITMNGFQKHEFTGWNKMSDLVLLTNRRHVEFVAKQVREQLGVAADCEHIRTFSAGVLVHTNQIETLMELRTFSEMLYQVKGMISLPMDAAQAAAQIIDSTLMEFLNKRHIELKETPYYFRIELKTSMDLGSKSAFLKKLSAEIENRSENQLVNNTSNYELEIRLIETKTGKFNCLIKLFSQKDHRFEYRRKSVAASMKPENAALIVALAKDYMMEDARVLDPFCGTGTLLIERQKAIKANTSYGIDVYGDAVEAAKTNTEAARQIIHYINKNYFEFEHEYLFDEIITELPFETGHKDSSEIEQIYKNFFKKAKQNLTGNGRIVLYTRNRDYVERYAKISGYGILKHEIILEKAGTDLYILEVK